MYGTVRVLRDEADLQWLQERLASVPKDSYVAVDFEAWSSSSLRVSAASYFQHVQLMTTAIAYEPHWRAVILHVHSDIPERRWLEPLQDHVLAVYHAGYDIRLWTDICGEPPARYIDALTLAGLVTAGRVTSVLASDQEPSHSAGSGGHSLADMAALLLGLPLSKRLRKAFSSGSGVLVDEELIRYNAEDASTTWWLTSHLLLLVRQEQVEDIAQLEHELSPCLLHMSRQGVRVDEDEVRRYAQDVSRRIEQTKQHIYELLCGDEWTAMGPLQPGLPSSELDRDSLLPKMPPHVLRAKHTVGGAARHILHHAQTGAFLRMCHLARLALDAPQTRLYVFSKPNDPQSELIQTVAGEAILLNSSAWVTEYMRSLAAGLVRSTRAQQLQTFANAVMQDGLPPLSSTARFQLAAQLVWLLLKYRGLTKLLGSFIEPWLHQHIQRTKSGARIYTTFLQTKARSGRIVSQNPNMQNVARPRVLEGSGEEVDTEVDLRGAIIADDGCLLVTADYSQYELRVAAERAQETRMIEMFQHAYEIQQRLEGALAEHGLRLWHKPQIQEVAQRDEQVKQLLQQLKAADLHRWVASLVFQKPQEEITSEERTMAKAVSFGVLYGMGAATLGQRLRAIGLSCTTEQAQEILQNYFKSFPKLVRYIDDVKLFITGYGYASTILGRKRWCVPFLPLLEPPDREPFKFLRNLYVNRLAATERELFNHTIQGVNADAIKLAILLLYRRLMEESEWDISLEHPVLTIHDELVVQVRADRADLMAERVLACMTEASRLAGLVQVPTVVEINVSPRWSK